jgi:predicted O-methyltransferase YrrM
MSLWQTLAIEQPKLPGWCIPSKAESLAAIVMALRPEVSLEIGVFGGSSFIPIALAHKEIGFGMAYGVDPWSAQESMKGETPANIDWWGKQDHEKLYVDFMAKLKELGLENCTRIFRQTSDSLTPPNTIDLLSLDGNHSEQAIRDVSRFAPRIRIGGICVMDDLEWPTGQVRIAEHRLIGLGFRKLYTIDTSGVYQRLK